MKVSKFEEKYAEIQKESKELYAHITGAIIEEYKAQVEKQAQEQNQAQEASQEKIMAAILKSEKKEESEGVTE